MEHRPLTFRQLAQTIPLEVEQGVHRDTLDLLRQPGEFASVYAYMKARSRELFGHDSPEYMPDEAVEAEFLHGQIDNLEKLFVAKRFLDPEDPAAAEEFNAVLDDLFAGAEPEPLTVHKNDYSGGVSVSVAMLLAAQERGLLPEGVSVHFPVSDRAIGKLKELVRLLHDEAVDQEVDPVDYVTDELQAAALELLPESHHFFAHEQAYRYRVLGMAELLLLAADRPANGSIGQ